MNPVIVERPQQPFIGIEAEATHENLPQVIGSLFGELVAWMGEHRVEATGAPFVRYLFVDDREDGPPTRLQVAFPCGPGISGGGRVITGTLPGGPFLTHLHLGPWCDLNQVTGQFLAWGEAHGVRWQRDAEEPRQWAARLEIYHNDPESEPDPAKRRTELAFLLDR